MIKTISFENFKGFEKLDVPEVAPITIIGGENNIGKTSLLEGIHLFYNRNDPEMLVRHLMWRGVPLAPLDAETIIAPLFHDFDPSSDIKIVVDDDDHHVMMQVSLSRDPLSLEEKDHPAPSSTSRPKVKYLIEGQEPIDRNLLIERSDSHFSMHFEPATMSAWPEQMSKGAIYIGPRMKLNKDHIARFVEVAVEKGYADILSFLQTIEPKLTDIIYLPESESQPMIYANIGMKQQIPITLLGDGINRLLLIIVAIIAAKNGIVLIDDIDADLHFLHMNEFWEQICQFSREYNCQVIATTHSYECLLKVYGGVTRNDRIEDFCFVRIDGHDRYTQHHVAKTYSHDMIGTALDAGWEVR